MYLRSAPLQNTPSPPHKTTTRARGSRASDRPALPQVLRGLHVERVEPRRAARCADARRRPRSAQECAPVREASWTCQWYLQGDWRQRRGRPTCHDAAVRSASGSRGFMSRAPSDVAADQVRRSTRPVGDQRQRPRHQRPPGRTDHPFLVGEDVRLEHVGALPADRVDRERRHRKCPRSQQRRSARRARA